MAGRPRTRAEAFLDEHRALRDARDRSAVWLRIRATSGFELQGRRLYVVGGDTLGGEDELYLDRLARGARAAGSDELSRELYLELPEELKKVVDNELLRQPLQDVSPETSGEDSDGREHSE
jgi:hypothetical protein